MQPSTRRYGRSRTARATAGEVFIALSRDEWAKERLGEVYRKLFEGEGLRQGSSPDHFIYVTPRKAREELNELSAWIEERFGSPAGTVPAKTPFGYLSGRFDGWITLFAALMFGADKGLAVDFTESVAQMSWSSLVSRSDASSPPAASSPPVYEEPSGWNRFLNSPRSRGNPVTPSTGRVIFAQGVVPQSSQPEEKLTFVEKFLGVPAREAPPPPIPSEPSNVWTEEEEVIVPSSNVGGGYNERIRGYSQRGLSVEDLRGTRGSALRSPSPLTESSVSNEWTPEDEVEDEQLQWTKEMQRRVDEADAAYKNSPQYVIDKAAEEDARRKRVERLSAHRDDIKTVRATAKRPTPAESEDEVEAARVRAALDEREREESRRRQAEREAREKMSTVDQLKRPGGGPTFG